MRRFLTFPSLLVACTAGAAALLACGGISDPSRNGASTEQTATVTGTLTGSAVPSGARVALLWRTSGPSRVLVGADVPVVGNTFTMTIGTPPESAFAAIFDDGDRASFDDDVALPGPGSSTSGSGGTDTPGSTSSSSSSGSSGASTSSSSGGSTSGSPSPLPANVGLRPMDNVTGTVVTDAMSAALGGFVIYVDANGNGQLDVEPNSSLTTTDTIVGGNRELLLAHLRGGGTLAYEKLRDKAGVLPAAGLNLMWSENERWLPLTAIELGLSTARVLPSAVCSGTTDTQPSSYTEPSPSELVCAPDGRSYWYESGPCTMPPPAPPGLCSSDAPDIAYGCGGASGPVDRLPPGEAPAWWPCPVGGTAAEDAGAPNVTPPGIDAGAP